MITDGDVIGQNHDESGWVRTGFLFFRRHKIDLSNCSLFFVLRRKDLFRWQGGTRGSGRLATAGKGTVATRAVGFYRERRRF